MPKPKIQVRQINMRFHPDDEPERFEAAVNLVITDDEGHEYTRSRSVTARLGEEGFPSEATTSALLKAAKKLAAIPEKE